MEKPWLNVDCRLALTDSPVAEQPEFVQCPHHDDSTPSFAIYANGGYCHGCHFRLGRMETLAYLLYGSAESISKAFAVCEKYTTDAIDAYRARVDQNTRSDPLPHGLARAYRNTLLVARKSRLQWFYDRGLSSDTILSLELGHDGIRFTIPVFDQHDYLRTIRFRRDDQYGLTTFDARRGEEVAIPKYSGMRGRNGLFLYALGLAAYDWAVVCEGELDAARLYQEGIPAVSPTNGAGNVSKVPALLQRDYPLVQRLFFATDQDAPGTYAASDGMRAAKELGFSATRLLWDAHYKDVTELYQARGSLEEVGCYGDETGIPATR